MLLAIKAMKVCKQMREQTTVVAMLLYAACNSLIWDVNKHRRTSGWGKPYYINITFPARVIVENIIPRNVIINRGAAEVYNHISRDDIFDYHRSRKCNIYFIIPNRTLDPLFSEELLLLTISIMGRGDPKGK